MSNSVFPTLAGLGWNVVKTPSFKTTVKETVSGTEYRGAWAAYPVYDIELTYNVLRDDLINNELKTLMGFFLQRLGSWDAFLYEDPDDNSVTDQTFGTGNGSTAQFQLLRSYGGFAEPVQNVKVLTNLKDNGTPLTSPTNYSIDSAGLVTFVTPPAVGHDLTWTGTYYYRVRFTKDKAEFTQFMRRFWEAKKVDIKGCTWNKLGS